MPRRARSCIAIALLLACSTGAAHGQTSPVSSNLSWDHCAGDGQIVDRTFACNTNTGSDLLVLSMVLHDSTRTGLLAWGVKIDVTPVSSTVPPWWSFGTFMCRPPGMLSTAEPPTLYPTGCQPWYGTSLPIKMATFYYGAGDRFYMALQGAVQMGNEVALLAEQEYDLCWIQLTHVMTVGTGSCGGCSVPTCLGVSQLTLGYPSPRPYDYFAGAGLNSVTWQGGYVASYPTQSGAPCSHPSLCPYTNQLQCTTPPVPTQGRTWGLIKTMYR